MVAFRIDPEFKALLREQTAEEHTNLRIQIETDGVRPGSLIVANLRGDLVLLDGHNTLAICKEKRIPLPKPVIIKMPDRATCIEWILKNALSRRNLTAEQIAFLRDRRDQRIVEARQEGESTRAIAEAEKVSQKTVMRVLEKATESGDSVQPTSGVVNSRDGVERPATVPEFRRANNSRIVFCERCSRVGPVRNCTDCKIARKRQKGTDPRKRERTLGGRMPPPNGAPAFEMRTLTMYLGKAMAEFDKLRRWPGQRNDPRHAAAVRLLDEAKKLGETWLRDARKAQKESS